MAGPVESQFGLVHLRWVRWAGWVQWVQVGSALAWRREMKRIGRMSSTPALADNTSPRQAEGR